MAATEHAFRTGYEIAPALQVARLYEQHQRMVAALCRLLLRDPVEAEDAVQQTFLSAFGSLIAGTEPRQPAAWLAAIARRECWARTAQRRRRPLPLAEAGDTAAGSGDPVEDAIRSADVAALWHAINGLPRTQREAFLMREFAGLSYAEVAVALGVTESAIESLLVRARRQLRDGLATTATTMNVVLTPLVLLQQRVLRLFGGGNAAARAGAATAVGVPAAAKLTATTAVIVAVGTVGVGLKAALPGGHRPAPPSLAAPHRGTPAPVPARAVVKHLLARRNGLFAVRRRTPTVRGSRPTPTRTARPAGEDTARTPGTSPSQTETANAPDTADGSTGRSTSTDPPPVPPTTGSVQDPADATPSASAPTDTTSTDTPQPDTAPTDGSVPETTQSEAARTDTTQTDTTQTETTSTDAASS